MHCNFKFSNGMSAGQVAHRVAGEKQDRSGIARYSRRWRKALCWSADSRFSRR